MSQRFPALQLGFQIVNTKSHVRQQNTWPCNIWIQMCWQKDFSKEWVEYFEWPCAVCLLIIIIFFAPLVYEAASRWIILGRICTFWWWKKKMYMRPLHPQSSKSCNSMLYFVLFFVLFCFFCNISKNVWHLVVWFKQYTNLSIKKKNNGCKGGWTCFVCLILPM